MPKIRVELEVPKNCEFCKYAISHYSPICVSYVCDLFVEE